MLKLRSDKIHLIHLLLHFYYTLISLVSGPNALHKLLRNPYDADNSNINGDVALVLCYGIKNGMSIGEYWVSFSGAR